VIKVGFVGFGRMGITHFSILNTHPEVQITAVCDQSKTLLNVLKSRVDVAVYTDMNEMFATENLDLVIISTPTSSHSAIVCLAVANNCHIFVEKPFSLTPSEGREALSLLEGRKLVNQVGYVNRFNEVFVEVRRLLGGGVIGDIVTFTSEMYGATVLKDSSSGWRGATKLGGGCMYEFASHCIDLVVYLVGAPDRVTGSVMQSIFSSGVEDLVTSTFIYDRGCSGMISVNWSDETFRKPANIFTIIGTKGKIIADKHEYKIYLKDEDQINGFHKGWNTRYITEFAQSVRFYVRGNEFTLQLDHVIDLITAERTETVCDFAEALKTDQIMENIRKDAALTMSEREVDTAATPLLLSSRGKSSLWSRFRKVGDKGNA
jgi:scyllo-inositol 2-dehydrogenase (NADP+)